MSKNDQDEFDIQIEDHLEPDHESSCGYCGHSFSSHERRIEKYIYGQKWCFCTEECLRDFQDASNFSDVEEEGGLVARFGSLDQHDEEE